MYRSRSLVVASVLSSVLVSFLDPPVSPLFSFSFVEWHALIDSSLLAYVSWSITVIDVSAGWFVICVCVLVVRFFTGAFAGAWVIRLLVLVAVGSGLVFLLVLVPTGIVCIFRLVVVVGWGAVKIVIVSGVSLSLDALFSFERAELRKQLSLSKENNGSTYIIILKGRMILSSH